MSNLKRILFENLKNFSSLINENEGFKTMHFNLDENKTILKHSNNAHATIQVFSGHIEMNFDNRESIELVSGNFLPFNANIKHEVIVKEKSVVIVTSSKINL